jgi:hypothetical protein
MRTAPFRLHDRAFTIEAIGVGPGTGDDPYDAIDYMIDWLEGKTATQIRLYHAVLSDFGPIRPDGFRLIEADEIRAAQAAALCFALKSGALPRPSMSVVIHAINPVEKGQGATYSHPTTEGQGE